MLATMLRPFGVLVLKDFKNYLAFQPFGFEHT
jgi:hypothetical protein